MAQKQRVPTVGYVAAPLCLPYEFHSDGDSTTSYIDPAGFEVRTYTVELKCGVEGSSHCFLFVLLEDRRRQTQLGDDELRIVADVANQPSRLQDVQAQLPPSDVQLCPRPFSVGLIVGQPEIDYDDCPDYIVHGLLYHCHCPRSFSKDCWLGATAALHHLRSLGPKPTPRTGQCPKETQV
ncbi:nuclear protein [Macropodid alphaherpesvirus 1]|uniref:Nuclear protein n=1 Tax=Macropodid alphaherpesvirus 1 TaxID=137443 RepID=A0A0Y0ACM6_9ALPH|nr:nuclear protein [Macropodid alphaherpesvirus 1]AMB17056.1 nuclear protein [Macropodid alphaherpesvirus 1]